MSNVGRPRTGMKACPHCGDKNRDSNGQCRCRNTAYRALRGAAKTTAEKARKVYDAALKSNKGDVDKALATMREEFPSLAAKARKAPADNKPKQDKADKPAAKKAAAKKAVAKKAAAPKAEKAVEAEAPATKAEPERYILHVEDDLTEPKPFARKDAAIKGGVRSGEAWRVMFKGKVVAVSDDLL